MCRRAAVTRSVVMSVVGLMGASLALSGTAAADPEPGSPAKAADRGGNPTTPEAILRRFARAPGLVCRYVEEKQIALLAAPLRSEGRIFFSRRLGRMVRRVERPEPARAWLADGTLTLEERGRITRISVTQNPVLEGFLTSFRAVLAGDVSRLQRFYRVATTGEAASWTLVLRPRPGPLSRFVQEISIRGNAAAVTDMTMVERSGDRTVTRFLDVDLSRPLRATELRELSVSSP